MFSFFVTIFHEILDDWWIFPVQCLANIRIFEYIQIHIDKYFHLYKYVLDFRAKNIFRHFFSFFFFHCKYSSIYEYSNIFRRIYSFGKYLLDLAATNIFRYSFVKEKLHSLHTVPVPVSIYPLYQHLLIAMWVLKYSHWTAKKQTACSLLLNCSKSSDGKPCLKERFKDTL